MTLVAALLVAGGSFLLLRACGAILRDLEQPLILRVAGWLLCAVSCWVAAPLFGAWPPLWVVLIIGLGGAAIATPKFDPTVRYLVDGACLIAAAGMSSIDIHPFTFIIALIVIPALGYLLEQYFRRVSPLARRTLFIGLLLPLTLLAQSLQHAGITMTDGGMAALLHVGLSAQGGVARSPSAAAGDGRRPVALILRPPRASGSASAVHYGLTQSLLSAGFALRQIDGEVRADPEEIVRTTADNGSSLLVAYGSGCGDALRLLATDPGMSGSLLFDCDDAGASRDFLQLAASLPADHAPLLFVRPGTVDGATRNRLDAFYQALPGRKGLMELPQVTRTLNAALMSGIVIGDTRVVRVLADRLRILAREMRVPMTLERGATMTMDRSGFEFESLLEWDIDNPTFTGNPYDLDAYVTFRHQASGESRTTGMFYDGWNRWRFRFTANRAGSWIFTSSSDDPDLDGLSGEIQIAPRPGARGFVTSCGPQWAWSGTDELFVPQLVMYAEPQHFFLDPDKIERDIRLFLIEHGFSGLHVPVSGRWFDIGQQGVGGIEIANPDRRTFLALESLIRRVHRAGGLVHLWQWGDEQRRQTPAKWGINGTEDRRLQRYIAARLGPIPGWTMGYGFDLEEWTDRDDLRLWHENMHRHLGWFHFLGGRSIGPVHFDPEAPFPQPRPHDYEGMDYWSYDQIKPTYEAYVADIEARPTKPSFSEDRFRIRNRAKDYSMEETRRGLWHSTMAGGVANIWGNLRDGGTAEQGSAPYPEMESIKTYAEFFRNRFRADLQRESDLSDGIALANSARTHFIFYKEDATTVRFDLSEAPETTHFVAVDTRAPYQELSIGLRAALRHSWNAPYRSDWAIAAGPFGKRGANSGCEFAVR